MIADALKLNSFLTSIILEVRNDIKQPQLFQGESIIGDIKEHQ